VAFPLFFLGRRSGPRRVRFISQLFGSRRSQSFKRSCQIPVNTTTVPWPAGADLKRTPPLADLKAMSSPIGFVSE
jgi:hypothetical protein